MDSKPIIQSYIAVSGEGKTYLALKHIDRYDRQIRIDAQPMGSSDVQKGCEVVRTVPELLAYVKANKDGPFKVCIWPKGLDLKAVFSWVCKIAIIYRRIAILADEAYRYIGRNLCAAGQAVFFQSRHSQTRLFYTMFNPKTVSPEMRGNTSKTHLFKSHEENFTEYLKKRGASPEVMDKYASDGLPKYSYALIETGKKPRIITPETSKPLVKKRTAPKKKAGRRGKK